MLKLELELNKLQNWHKLVLATSAQYKPVAKVATVQAEKYTKNYTATEILGSEFHRTIYYQNETEALKGYCEIYEYITAETVKVPSTAIAESGSEYTRVTSWR